MSEQTPDLVVAMTGFARALRVAGLAADRTRLSTSLAALACIDSVDAQQVYWATRLTFCSDVDDISRFDAVFDAWFRPRAPAWPGSVHLATRSPSVQPPPVAGRSKTDEQEVDDESLPTAASDAEILRNRDVTGLSAEERVEVNRMIALLSPRVATHRTPRRVRGGDERLDVRRTVRLMIRHGGEPGVLRYDRRAEKPRRLVILVDVSGSMAPYADVLMRFAHAAMRACPERTEVFTVSTRLTRVTRQLQLRDPAVALQAAGRAIPDWRGGTRLGESLRAFLDGWGQVGTARRAVVLIASDGWERGDAGLLGQQMGRLARLAHKVVWVNPHQGKAGFAPVTAGMSVALPHVDELVAGHTFDALSKVAEVISRW